MSNFMSIGCYLLLDPLIYFLCIILNYKNLKFKHLIDNMVIDLWSFENFVSMEDIRRKYNPIVDLLKFIFNKKILSEIVALDYHKICCYTLSFYQTRNWPDSIPIETVRF